MQLEKIDACIKEYEQKYNFIFPDKIVDKIHDGCESWKNDWVVVFRKLLGQIKNGKGIPANDKENGNRITSPLVKDQYMAIYFHRQPNGSIYIYRFLIE